MTGASTVGALRDMVGIHRVGLGSLSVIVFLAAILWLTGARSAAAQHVVDGDALAAEISVHDLMAATRAYVGERLDDGRNWSRGSRVAHWLPDTRVELRYTVDDDLQNQTTLDSDILPPDVLEPIEQTDRVTDDLNTTRMVRVVLDWELGGLAWSGLEDDEARRSQSIFDAETDATQQAVELYYERASLLIERDELGADDVASMRRSHIAIAYVEAQLDVLTGGWFTRQLRLTAYDPER